MPAIALLNDGGELLGFLLVAGGEPVAAGQSYDCILTGFPKNAALLDTPLSRVIQDHKHDEFTLRAEGDPLVLTVDLRDGWLLRLSLGVEGTGPWSARHSDGTELSGICILAKKAKG